MAASRGYADCSTIWLTPASTSRAFPSTPRTSLGTGISHPDRQAYVTYVVPGILIVTVASAALGTAIAVAMDMTGGIIDRFRTMAITRAAVLTGHVVGSLLQTLAVLVLVVGVALAIGFRPTANR